MPRKMIASASMAVAMLVGAGGSVVLAPAASAAETHYVTLTCQAPTTIYGDVGDTFIFTMANTCSSNHELWNVLDDNDYDTGFLAFVSATNYGNIWDTSPANNDWYGTSNGSGTTTFTTTLLQTNIYQNPLTLTVGGAVAITYLYSQQVEVSFPIIYGGNPVSDVADQTPPPVSQAVATPVSGSCLDVKDADLNWGGAESGNWKPSWQQWVNNGAGGGVCQRTLNYVGAGKWAAS
jgi:hypothetical protein